LSPVKSSLASQSSSSSSESDVSISGCLLDSSSPEILNLSNFALTFSNLLLALGASSSSWKFVQSHENFEFSVDY
uniref:REJ domain-containing protein n=1 Tax=Haemonchus placei TaxID=6290 RepID=A0A0N4W3E3_HAEPC